MNDLFQEPRLRPTQSSFSPPAAAKIPSIVQEVVRLPGQPLDPATRAFMEPRFGHNFGKVRVHNDAKAAESVRSINAQAYTVGQHIALGESSFPRTLLAHELAHTIHQHDTTPAPEGVGKNATLEADANRAAAEVEKGGLSQPLKSAPSVRLQKQPAASTTEREEQLWKELGIDLLLASLELKLKDNQFPHPDTILSGKGMEGQGTQLALGGIYDTTNLEFKLHTYSWDWIHSSLRLQSPEKLTHKELAYLYYWYGDETKEIQRALEKIAVTIADEQRRKELQEVAAYFKATERFVEVTFGGSAAIGIGAGLIGTGAVASGLAKTGRAATSLYVRGQIASGTVATAAGGAALKVGTEILTNPAVQWAGQNPNTAIAAVETAATSGPKILEGTYTKEDALFDILTLGQARGADVSLGGSRPVIIGDEPEGPPVARPPTTSQPEPTPTAELTSGSSSATSSGTKTSISYAPGGPLDKTQPAMAFEKTEPGVPPPSGPPTQQSIPPSGGGGSGGGGGSRDPRETIVRSPPPMPRRPPPRRPIIEWFPQQDGTAMSPEDVLQILEIDHTRVIWSFNKGNNMNEWNLVRPKDSPIKFPPLAFTSGGKIRVDHDRWIEMGYPEHR